MKTNWQTKKLGEVCKIGDGNHSSKYPKKNEMINKGVPFIRANNLVSGYVSWADIKFISKEKHEILKKGHLKTGDVLFTNRGEIGKIAIVGADFNNSNLNSQIAWFRCTEQLNNKFLFYFLSSPKLQSYYLVEKNGAALQQFTIKQINNLDVPIPSFSEQKRIVKILDEVFENVEKAKENDEKNLNNSKELYESYLQNVFANPGKDWEEKKLEEIGQITSSKRIYKKEYVANGVPFYRIKEIKELAHDKNISLELYISRKRYKEIKDVFGVPLIGDILMTAVGTIGEIYVVKNNEEFYFKDGNILWFKNFNSVDPYFLKYVLMSFVEQIKTLSKGSAYSALTIEKIEKHKIFIPKSITEQKNIVKKLDALSEQTKKLEAVYKQKLADLEELKKSILNKAFNGEL